MRGQQPISAIASNTTATNFKTLEPIIETTRYVQSTTYRPPPTLHGDQRALAFTPEQYTESEKILGKSWDRAHTLENLSGFETRCEMIDRSSFKPSWSFNFMHEYNRENGLNIKAIYGFAPNRGSTPAALIEIIPKFISEISRARRLGCSLIPDCIDKLDGSMWVVVTCFYD